MRTGIIGCRGRMGRMLTEHLRAAGHEVKGADLPMSAPDIAAACAGAEIVFLCVPADVLDEVCRITAPHLPQGCILSDVTSVKITPLRLLESRWQGPVVGTHPLFGPESQYGPVAITPGRGWKEGEELPEQDAGAVAAVEQLFASLNWPTFRCTPAQHDHAVALVQGVNYLSNLAYFALLKDEALSPFLTPSFRRRRDAARTMLTEDADLFARLFAANPASPAAVRDFQEIFAQAAAHPELLLDAARQGLHDTDGDDRQDDGKG